MGTRPLAAPSTERLLASLLIKLKPSPQLTLHGRPSCVACGGLATDWTGLLHIVCCTGLRAPPSRPPYRRRVTALSKGGRCSDVHVASSMQFDWSSVVTDETESG